ncbi:MAG TPA: helix-hairpin-helix domain-containing protein, partial [Halococcus sp.]|nr:helix-hairpin-helix domain-containing protein [Halococcus sp.]
GLAEDEEELSWRYKTALAPNTFKRHDGYAEIDGKYYTQTLVVRDWPANPAHGFFDKIVSLSMPKVSITISTHLVGEDEREAQRKLSGTADSLRQRVRSLARKEYVPDYFVNDAVEEYADVKRTQNTVSASDYSLYTSDTYIEVRAPTTKKLGKAVRKIQSKMQDVSADAKPLKHHPKKGYQTAAPACKNYVGGKTKMTGDGLARLMPWTAQNLIEPGGINLGTNEDTGDPIILDLQNRETGFNVGVWGTIGAGKTTTVTRLLMRLKMKNPEMPLVIIDPKQEFAGLTWLFDGQTVKIGSDTGINPLQIEETPPKKLDDGDEDEGPYRNAIRRAMDFVRSFYEYQGLPFEDVQDTWREAIKEAYSRRGIKKNPETHSNDSPTLKDDVFPILLEMLNSPENFVHDGASDVDISVDGMQKRADKIIHEHTGALQEGGEFEHLSMETSIDLKNIDVLYLDLQNYENETTAGLMMGPLLTSVLEQAKEIDEPMALAMDEFHYMLANSSSLETLKQAYRHSRHSDLSMITATQSVEEFFTQNDEGERQLTNNASQLTKLMSVKIWHYLEGMNDEWASEFDITEAEKERVKNANKGDPTAQALLQLQGGESYRLSVDFSDQLTPREFAMNQYDASEDETDPLVYLSEYSDRKGRDVTEWTWEEMSYRDHPLADDGEQTRSEEGVELADGTVVTSDVADVETPPTPTAETDSSEQPSGESSTETDGENESNIRSADEVIEATSPDEEQSDGLAARLKQSVTGEKNTDEDTDDDELSLTALGAVTARTAGNLQDAGFESVEQVYTADEGALVEVDGFDEQKADNIQAQAAEALGIPEDAHGPDSESSSKTAGSEPDAETDADTDTEPDSDESTVETEQEPDDKPTATVEFTPSEETTDSESDADPDPDTEPDESGDSAGIAGRMKDSLGSVFSHPAAGKSHPDLTDIGGVVDEQKAAVLCNAGFETVEEVYTADPSALAEVEGIDETHAGYVQNGAEQALDASDATLPESAVESEADTAAEDGSETSESIDQPDEDPQPSESSSDVESGDTDDIAVESNGDEPAQPALTDIREVGDDRADDLRERGFETVEDVATVGQNTLTEVEGIGEARAETISASASDLLEHSEGAVAEPAGGDD